MKKCSYCGRENGNEAIGCSECGTSFMAQVPEQRGIAGGDRSGGVTSARRAIYVVGGMLWFLVSLGFGFILMRYVEGGAGLQFFGGPVSSGSVMLGLAHVTGFIVAAIICFAIGAVWCAHGLVLDRGYESRFSR